MSSLRNFIQWGDSQSPRPVPFSRLLRHAENTLALFLWYHMLSIYTYIGIHRTCTTDTAQTFIHLTLMYNIFTSTLGTKCVLPVSYARQQPRAAPAEPHLTPHFIYRRRRARCSSAYSLTQNTLHDFRCRLFGSFWISLWI